MDDKLEKIKRLNKKIVHKDGSYDSFEKQLRDLRRGRYDETKPLVVSPDSTCISYFEPDTDKPITMRVSTAIKILEKHEIDQAIVGRCVDLLGDSVMAFESMTHDSSVVVVLDAYNAEKDQIIAICRRDRLMNMIEVNEITSIYDKQGFEEFLIRTFDADKTFFKNKKTEQYIKSQRLQLPKEMIYALSDGYYKPNFTKSQLYSDNHKQPLDQKIQSAVKRLPPKKGSSYEQKRIKRSSER